MAKHTASPKRATRLAPDIAPNVVFKASEVRAWFEDVLLPADAAPSLVDCEDLATKFRIILNRQNNVARWRDAPGDLSELKDVSFEEFRKFKLQRFMDAADVLLFEAFELLVENWDDYKWEDSNGTVYLEDVTAMLWRIGACTTPRSTSKRGRPREAWHLPGREMARLIMVTMRNAGYQKRRLRMQDSESITASVGAAAVSRAYGIDIKPSGFAAAMKARDRTKREPLKTFAELYPHAARIKVL
jgi:hypothetical protein